MKKLIFTLVAFCGFSGISFAHEDLHDFEIYLTVRGAPIVMYKVNQVPHKLADVLCDNLTSTVKAWKLAPGTDPLILDSLAGKVTIFSKNETDVVYCRDITPQRPKRSEVIIVKQYVRQPCRRRCWF